MNEQPFGEYLFSTLASLSVRHVFGIPGDYVLPLYRALDATDGIEAVVATHEPCAAFSADAYGRQTGLGVLLVTYGVGGFNAMNGVAGAYAEQSPLLVISGGPPRGYAPTGDPLEPIPHHVLRTATDQMDAYGQITDLALRLNNPATAAQDVVRAATWARDRKRPVYLEVPTDLMNAPIPVGTQTSSVEPAFVGLQTDLDRAVTLFTERMSQAKRPVLLVGIEVARHGLQPEIRRLMQTFNAPAVTTVLAKSALPDTEPGVLGVYAGVLSTDPGARKLVESSDLVVLLGTLVTDVNCGAFTADLHRDRMLIARSGWIGDSSLRLGRDLAFAPFLRDLAKRSDVPATGQAPDWPTATRFDYQASTSLMDQYMGVIEDQLQPSDVVVADTGDACCGSMPMRIRRQSGYLANAFYGSMGFAVPAALGAQLAEPDTRAVVLVGDGAFQMTGMELSNAVRRGLDPLVILFNNDGFGMQRVFQDGPFNDIGRWDYQKLPALLGGGRAWRADSPDTLRAALAEARDYRDGPSIIEAVLPKGDISRTLQVFGQAFSREKTGACPVAPPDAPPCDHHDTCSFCRAAIWK
jgi:TPP-dependent 2-oxoacid decarboxylase